MVARFAETVSPLLQKECFKPMHADIEVADLDLWASDTDDASTQTKITTKKHECANLRVPGRLQGLQQVCVHGFRFSLIQ